MRVRWGAVTAGLVMAIGSGFVVFLVVVASDRAEGGTLAIAGIGFTAVGSLLLSRVPGNRVGWVMALVGLAILGAGVVGYFADQGSVVAGAIGGALWLSWFFLVGLLMLWFPTGQPPGPRWRWVAWLGYVGQAVSLTYIVSDQLCVEGGDPCQAWIDNPIGVSWVPNPEFGAYSGALFGMLGIFVLLSITSLVVRAVRARGVERLQIKWFLFAVILFVTIVISQETIIVRLGLPDLVGELLFGLSALMLPVTIGIAVLRFRLYEIDRIISRTVSYTLVLVLLGALFLGAVTVVTSFLRVGGDLAVAGATLAVAALFNPVRRRVQRWVDRRFNRSHYDAEQVMDRFTASLRSEIDASEVVNGWVGVVSETMQPSAVAVWVRSGR